MNEPILDHLIRCSLWERIEMKGETLAAAAQEIQNLQSKLSSCEKERDELIRAVGEHITVRSEYLSRLDASQKRVAELEAYPGRAVYLATSEALEHEQAERKALESRLSSIRLELEKEARGEQSGEYTLTRLVMLTKPSDVERQSPNG